MSKQHAMGAGRVVIITVYVCLSIVYTIYEL
jgi:hypothetical protein